MDRAEYLLFQLFREVPCHLFLDVGSRDGESALRASRVIPDARFICFEARRANYERMRADPRIDREGFEVEHLALSDTDGVVRFNVYENPEAPRNTGLGSLRRRRDLDPVEVEKVRAVTLDRYLSDSSADVRDLVLWIDVEGAALDVLRGAARSLASTNVIYVEVEVEEIFEDTDTRADVVRYLGEHGFRELLFRPHGSGAVGDSIFVSEEVYRKHDIASRLRWWNARYRVAAPYHRAKGLIFDALSRVPGFLDVWRRIKPRPR